MITASAEHPRRCRNREAAVMFGSTYFRFWQLVRQSDGSYVARPYVTLYPGEPGETGLVEIVSYARKAEASS